MKHVLKEFIRRVVSESMNETSDTGDIQKLWHDYKWARTFLSNNRDLIKQYQSASWSDVISFVEDYAERLKADRNSTSVGSFPSEIRSTFPGLKLHSEVGMGDGSISWLALVFEDLRTKYPNMSANSLAYRVDAAVRRWIRGNTEETVNELLRKAEIAREALARGEGKFKTTGDQEAYEYGVRGDHYTVTYLPDGRIFKVGGRTSEEPGSLGS